MINDNSPNWAELYMLNKTAEAAILSGELDELRHANASTFHILSLYLMDLNDRLARLELSPSESVEPRIILEKE